MTTLADGFWHWLWFGDQAWTDTARGTDALFMWIFWFSAFWFVVLMSFMVFCVVAYRRRPGQPTPRSSSHNTPLEIAWTVIPSLGLVYIFFAGFQGYMNKVVAEGPALEYSLEAYTWGWDLSYPNGIQSAEATQILDVSTRRAAIPMPGQAPTVDLEAGGPSVTHMQYPIFYVPEDQPIRLRMTSRDVIHSFWVPDFRVKFDVFPNRYTSYWFRTERLSQSDPVLPETNGQRYRDHIIYCAEYCGDFHSEMLAILRVVSRQYYAEWVQTGGIDEETTPLAELGQIISRRSGCFACHSVDGSRNTGPTWQNAYGYDVQLTTGQTVPYDANYIRRSIVEPAAEIHAGYPNQMPSYAGVFSERQMNGIIAYIQSLSDRGPVDPFANGDPDDPDAQPDSDPSDPETGVETEPETDAEPDTENNRASEARS